MKTDKISVWHAKTTPPSFPELTGEKKTDVLIVGGGITGLLCAYFLKQAGVSCIVVEKDAVCAGITGNTTAKLTAQHGFCYAELLKTIGREKTRAYWEINQQAIERYRTLCSAIDGDFEEKDNFVYTLADRKKAEEEAAALQKLGIPAEFKETVPLPLAVRGAVKFPRQAQFHPLKFLFALAKDLPVFENTFVREFRGMTAVTDRGQIRAKKIIIATHFPILNKHGGYFIKMYQHRSYVIAGENAPEVNGMYVDCEDNGLSFRNYRNLLLIGGGGHKTGKPGGGWRELRNFAKTNYPDFSEKYCWAAQDCMTLDHIPYIGSYAKNTPGLYVATGFNKWGMTSSMAAAEILSDLIQGKQNPYAEIFSPSRNFFKPQLFVNITASAAGLLTPSAKRCPHMGCALHWNKAEHSWDCPCHGSRFSQEGKLLETPATGDLKQKS